MVGVAVAVVLEVVDAVVLRLVISVRQAVVDLVARVLMAEAWVVPQPVASAVSSILLVAVLLFTNIFRLWRWCWWWCSSIWRRRWLWWRLRRG